MKRVFKRLTMVYYTFYTGVTLSALIGMLLTKNSENVTIASRSSAGIALSSIVILYTIISIPLALGFFFKMTKKWKNIEDEKLKLRKYESGAILRMLLIGFGLIGSIVAFFLIRSDLSLLYCAGISGIVLIFFCRPTEAKIIADLDLDEE